MRICFSMVPQKDLIGGGGSKFANNFANYLTKKGIIVETRLNVHNLPDLIFMFDPRFLSHAKNWLTIEDIRKLQDQFSIKTPIIHRVNDTDKHPGRPPNFIENVTELANRAEKVIFVSEWVKEYYKKINPSKGIVIHNGVNKEVFRIRKFKKNEKLKLITHHWSTNKMKGWDYYHKIDQWIAKNPEVSFTIIGRIPDNMLFQNTTIIPPKNRKEVSEELRKANMYITASKFEACGNHYIEGVSSGLPLLFHEDGGGVWDMEKYGISYSNCDDLFTKIKKMCSCDEREKYYKKIVNSFDLYEEEVYKKYLEVINEIVG